MHCTDAKSAVRLVLGFGLALLTTTGPASAHPHVWVTMKSEVIYASDGSVTGIRHAWSFDDMFSDYALQGIEHKKNGVYTREELGPLAETNLNSFKQFSYFNYARIEGQKHEDSFADPVDYWLDYTDSVLTLHLPCRSKRRYARATSRSTSTIRSISSASALTRRTRSGSSMRRRNARWTSSNQRIPLLRSSGSTNRFRRPKTLPGWGHTLLIRY